MTNEELERLEHLARRATPGVWKFWTSNSWRRLKATEGQYHRPVIMPFTNPTDKQPDMSVSQADMDYIEAVQPGNMLLLIRELRQAREGLAIAKEALTYYAHMFPGIEIRDGGDKAAEALAEMEATHG